MVCTVQAVDIDRLVEVASPRDIEVHQRAHAVQIEVKCLTSSERSGFDPDVEVGPIYIQVIHGCVGVSNNELTGIDVDGCQGGVETEPILTELHVALRPATTLYSRDR